MVTSTEAPGDNPVAIEVTRDISGVISASKQSASANRRPTGAGADGRRSVQKRYQPFPSLSLTQFYLRYAEGLDVLMMLVGTLGGIVTGALIPYYQYLFGRILDSLNTGGDVVTAVTGVAIQFGYISVVAFIAANLQVFGWGVSGERQMARIRGLYVKSILRQDISWFDLQTRGQTATVVSELITALQDGLGRKNGDIAEYFTQFIGGFVIAFLQSWRLTLVLLASIPAIIIATAVMATLAIRAQKKESMAYAAAGSKAYESLSAIRTVQALRLQDKVKAAYDALLKQAEMMGYSKAKDNALGVGLLGLVVYSTFGLGFFYGSRLVADHIGCDMEEEGCITGGMVLSTFFAVIMGAMGLGSAFPCISSVMQGKAAAEQIFYVIARVPTIDSLSQGGIQLDTQAVKGEIELRNIVFAYPTRPEKKVCNGYHLKLQAGKTLALVEPSGEGKSTIMSLLLRFYDPQEGVVLLDGIPYKDINVKSLRSTIGLVSQEPILFSGSIKDNIKSGKEDSTDEEMVTAAKMADAHNFILSFAQGYDTFCGEGGSQLSGGQKQRIAIARALIKDPAILLLDEATSALDNKSEKVVQAALDKLHTYKKRTTIVIAHRLTTIENADQIAFVKGGKVVELGSHKELMQLNGSYAALVSSREESEEGDGDVEAGTDWLKIAEGAPEESQDTDRSNATRRKSCGFVDDDALALIRRRSSLLEHLTTVRDIETGGDNPHTATTPVKASQLLWGLALAEWDVFLIGLIGSMINGGGFPALGFLISKSLTMLNYQDEDRVREGGEFYGGMFALLGIIICIARFAQEFGLGVMSERMARKLRSMAFSAMIRRNISWFDREENSIGALTTQLSEDAARVNRVLGTSLGQLLQLIFCLTIALGLTFSASWEMALLMLGTLPLQIFGRIIAMAQMRRQQSDDSKDQEGTAGAVLSSAVLGIRIVAAFSLEGLMHVKYETLYGKTLRTRVGEAALGGLLLGYTQVVQYGTNGLLYYVAGVLISQGRCDFSQVMQATMVLMLGTSGLAMALKSLDDSRQAGDGAQRISRLIWGAQHQTIDAESEPGDKLKNFKGEIEFKNIGFHYPNRADQVIYGGPAFPKGYSLKVNTGETVALVGPSRGDKSTIMQLALRFYDPDAGKVLFDGVDARNLNVHWLRSQISYVGQEPVLFAGSIWENVINGRPDATEAEVIEACKAAQIHSFVITLPEGYRTLVDEGSINLSGGQKQQIALARAFIGDPKILLLDEATSALDNENEVKVQEALDNMQKIKQRTTLVIAHRLTTIEKADKIAVISGGGVVEIGTHAELLARNGMYAQLVHFMPTSIIRLREKKERVPLRRHNNLYSTIDGQHDRRAK